MARHKFRQRTQRTERPFAPIAVSATWYEVLQFGQTICIGLLTVLLWRFGAVGLWPRP